MEARQRRLDDPGGSRRFADVAVHESNLVSRRDLGGSGHLPGTGNDVETPFDKRFDDSRANALRSSGHDGGLSLAAHGGLPPNCLMRWINHPAPWAKLGGAPVNVA